MKTAFVIIRVSAEDQLRGYGPDTQWQDDIMPMAPVLGLDVSENYRRVLQESATSWERPLFEAAVREAMTLHKAGMIQALLFPRVDRETRFIFGSFPLLTEVVQSGLEVYFARERLFLDPNDPESIERYLNKASQSQAYVQTLKINTGRGLRARALRGKIPNGRTGYGFTYVPGKNEGEGIRKVNEAQAKWIRQWVRWILDDSMTLDAITLRMRGLRVPTASGRGIWRSSTIRGILTNPAIMGKTYSFTYTYEVQETPVGKRRKLIRTPRDKWVELPAGVTPAIITEDEFNAIQAKFSRNKYLAPRKSKHQFLLSGHVFCRYDNRRFRGKGQIVPSKSNRHYVYYYHCPGNDRIVSPDPCPNRRWNADKLETLVWRQIETLLSKPEVVLSSLKETQENTSQEVYVRQELENIEVGLKTIYKEQENLLRQSLMGFPEEMVVSENKKYNQERADLLKRKTELEAKIVQIKQVEANEVSIDRFCEMIKKSFGNLTFEDKRLAFEALGIKVWVKGDEVTIEGAIPIGEECAFDTLTPKSKN